MPIPVLDFSQFTSNNTVLRSPTSYTNAVSKGTIPGHPGIWIAKRCTDPMIARHELLAQEFFRLIIPHQPETLLAKDEPHNTYYVYSKEAEGYHALPEGEVSSFDNGTITGFGQAILVSVFLQEVDLKNGNIGVDKDNRVIKIDGDQCLASILGLNKRYDITPKVIAELPSPHDFYATNWLDMIRKGVPTTSYVYMGQIHSGLVGFTLTNSKSFRAEVNQAMLKICLLPDEYIEKFVSAYIPEGHKPDRSVYIDLITSRRKLLRLSAVQNESFRNYLSGPEAQEDAKRFMDHIRAFQAGGEFILPDEQERRQLSIDFSLKNLRAEAISAAFTHSRENLIAVKNAVEQEEFAEYRAHELASVFHLQMELKKQAQLPDASLLGMISSSILGHTQNDYQHFLSQSVNPVMEKFFTALVKNDFEQLEQVLGEFPSDEQWSAFTSPEAIRARERMNTIKQVVGERRVMLHSKILPALEQCKDALEKKNIPAALQALSALPSDENMERMSIRTDLKEQITHMKQQVAENLNALSPQNVPIVDDDAKVGVMRDPLLVEITKQIVALENEHCEDLAKLEMHFTTANDCLDTVEFLINERIKQHGASEEPLDLSNLEELKSRLQKIKKTDENALNAYPKENAEIAEIETQLSQALPQASNNTNPAKRTIKSDYDVDSENKVTKIGEDRPGFKPD
ncbi:SidE phosphodiesterase domain-containing protein [Legionella pneumophila]|uniref:SdeC protein, substrate of the Dot/Icm system n=1 Tax=Legionella pneumophila subsp. pascullei TaxID=91890 RepID=A0AAX2IXZ1_LEGPN|nr:SidE phosphodiesterase domain-containing protein [Legionella pneumophila]AMP89705.1 hypothetical protein AXF35_08430 [Legionella pneumophila subsp. pascullei]AMP92629.1 hypothetical protein AXF36_08370 [Legionella pneumophila subsp. pascullei]AMP95594.1 hypothetical protein AXF37_08260 [Legionella pneumophila subsp. pascullei]SQG90504.1 SdeC protein, substrate of the Dot/Icm system [Legionella pneumophila subsp. pascullei]VEH06842.1 SdeC protein, substrate of the Dot/Icm system [Legionella 